MDSIASDSVSSFVIVSFSATGIGGTGASMVFSIIGVFLLSFSG